MSTLWTRHKNRWSDCELCDLCNGRTKVVLARGSEIPCDMLFVGEAPGFNEDILGKPFIGEAGKLLDRMIDKAMGGDRKPLNIAFTNLIACIPKDKTGRKTTEPPEYAIEACRDRLLEFIELADPRVIILVGLAAKKYAPTYDDRTIRDMIHPAAILRMDVSQKGLAIQRCVVAIADAMEEVVPF